MIIVKLEGQRIFVVFGDGTREGMDIEEAMELRNQLSVQIDILGRNIPER